MRARGAVLACFSLIGALFLIAPVAAAADDTDPALVTNAEDVKVLTPEALEAYLARTPADAPPLGWLSPGGRARFLDALQFGRGGLASIPTADINAELTAAQAVALLGLFGVEPQYIRGLGIPPEEQARLRSEREAEARLQGCPPARCPPSALEMRFNAWQKASFDPEQDPQTAAGKDALSERYAREFGDWLQPADLRALTHSDLRLLQRATAGLLYFVPRPAPRDHMRAILAEMQRRGIATDRQRKPLHAALVAARDFPAAAALARQHPGVTDAALPAWREPGPLPAGQPTALDVDAGTGQMTRTSFALNAGLRIVVVASCHFSEDAAREISADPELDRLFATHGIWLADQGESIPRVAQWNRDFPRQPMHVAWKNEEWVQLDEWAMPTFYILRDGEVVDRWSGWPADTGMTWLQQHLRDNGIL